MRARGIDGKLHSWEAVPSIEPSFRGELAATIDAKIGATPGRVTLLSEQTLRIEPDDVCTTIAATTQDGRTTICALGRRGRQ